MEGHACWCWSRCQPPSSLRGWRRRPPGWGLGALLPGLRLSCWVPRVPPGCRGEPCPAAGHGDPGRALPWHQSLTPERIGFAFEVEQMAPNGTRFQTDIPEEGSAGLSHAPSTCPADRRLGAPCHLWAGGRRGEVGDSAPTPLRTQAGLFCFLF